jgi:hypothetical protein
MNFNLKNKRVWWIEPMPDVYLEEKKFLKKKVLMLKLVDFKQKQINHILKMK